MYFVHSYVDKHQIQLFGRGHIGGIDIKVCFCDCVNDSQMFMLKVPRPKVLWLTKKCIQMLGSILALHACPYRMVQLAPCQTSNPQPGGPGIFCRGILPLTTSTTYLKALEARLSPLSLRYITLPGSPNVEVSHMTCWQSLFVTVGHSWHF